MAAPILSIILPVYNGEAFVERAIKSVLNQELTDWELIVVNDGSTDRSEELIAGFCALDARIARISQENKGLSAARNAGYYKAAGKYIAFLDVDDYVEPNYYSGLVASTEESGADFVMSGYIREFIHADRTAKAYPVHFKKQLFSITTDRKQIITSCSEPYFYNVYIHVWNKLYRHDFLLRHGIVFDESLRYAEDVPYNIECLKHADSIQFLDMVGYHYICHQAERLTGKWRESLLEDNRRVFRQIFDFEENCWNMKCPAIACGMYLRSCFLTIEKASACGIRYKELKPVLTQILSSPETLLCFKILRQISAPFEFKVYKHIMQTNQPLLFWWAVLLRRKIKHMLGR